MCAEVFVTGVGIISPAGQGAEATWRALMSGARCVGPLVGLDLPAGCPDWGGQVREFVAPPGTAGWDRLCQLAAAAADEALQHSGGKTCRNKPLVISFGTSKGGLKSFRLVAGQILGASRQIDLAGRALDLRPDAPAVRLASRLPGVAAVHATVAACSTGTLSVVRGMQMIQDGDADIVVCGGADASLHPLWLAAFERMGVLARPHPAHGPSCACRPFDRSRSGFALGEGAAALVLQSRRTIEETGTRPLVRLSGYACGTDPAGLTSVSPAAEPLAHVIQLACRRAGLLPQDLAAVYAHGTGTTPNDLAESKAFRAVLGPAASSIPVVSLKGALGHLLGAAGAVEIALAVLATQKGESPGNRTLLDPDPAIGPLTLPRAPLQLRSGPVLKTSLGFGGHLAAVVIAPV